MNASEGHRTRAGIDDARGSFDPRRVSRRGTPARRSRDRGGGVVSVGSSPARSPGGVSRVLRLSGGGCRCLSNERRGKKHRGTRARMRAGSASAPTETRERARVPSKNASGRLARWFAARSSRALAPNPARERGVDERVPGKVVRAEQTAHLSPVRLCSAPLHLSRAPTRNVRCRASTLEERDVNLPFRRPRRASANPPFPAGVVAKGTAQQRSARRLPGDDTKSFAAFSRGLQVSNSREFGADWMPIARFRESNPVTSR